MKKEPRIIAIIPSFNVESTLGSVVENVKKLVDEIIVVNDGSVDRTRKIAEGYDVDIVDHLKNMGLGYALRMGFEEAMKKDFDAVITIDGDGQHTIEDIKEIIEVYKKERNSVILGSRLKNKAEWKNFPRARLIGNLLMTFLTNLACQRKITTDSQSGLRVIERNVLEKIRLKSKRMEIASEIVMEAHKRGFKIHEIPIKAIYRGEKSNYSVIFDTLRIFFVIARKALGMYKLRSGK
ncbi:MAG: glycosyltransferase family 2 protein [Acidobacteriota bacterium]